MSTKDNNLSSSSSDSQDSGADEKKPKPDQNNLKKVPSQKQASVTPLSIIKKEKDADSQDKSIASRKNLRG